MQAADALDDEEMLSAVVTELGKRFLSTLTGSYQGTKKRKRVDEDEDDASAWVSTVSYSPADQVCIACRCSHPFPNSV
jgi:hypothetical protein